MNRLLTMFAVVSSAAIGCGDSGDGTGGSGAEGGAGGSGGGGVECPGSDVVCAEGERCLAGVDGSFVGCTATCGADSSCGDTLCCAPGASCDAGSCTLADLVLSPISATDVTFSTIDVAEDACEVTSGCVAGPGRRLAVHFSVTVTNEGAGALQLGAPEDSPLFQADFCEDSYVLPHMFRARLSKDGQMVREGMLDARCVASGTGFDCAAQGIAPGASTAQPDAACDFIDATDLESGAYELEVTVNPDGLIAESNLANNATSVTIDFPACDGTICGGTCCPAGFECDADVCLVPDLTISGPAAEATLTFSHQSFLADSCEVHEGCVAGSGRRHLLQFESRIENHGPGHLNHGIEANNPLFELDECHGHYHFLDFSDYKLVDDTGAVVAQGHKQSFCIVDISPLDQGNPAPHGQPPPGSSGCNFLSAGWADVYGVGTPCQWVDVTGVPEGDYTLVLAVNPLGKVVEGDVSNNTVEIAVHVPEDTPCVPEPEICGDFIDQDCDDIPDNGCQVCFPFPETCGDGVDDNCNGVADDGCTPLSGTDTCATAGELTDSMSYSAEITAATQNDVALPCGGAGRDVFFHFTLLAEEVVYLSSFQSDMDTTMALYAGGACGAAPIECSADACGPTNGTHLAARLAAGDYYVVVKAQDADATGMVRIKYEHSAVGDGPVIQDPGLYEGDTSGAPIPVQSVCGPESPQDDYYVAMCPASSITVSSCGLTTFPMTLKIAPKATDQTEFQCSVGLPGCQSDPNGATLTYYAWDAEGSLGAITVGGEAPISQGPYTLFVKF
ncbi:MAG: hypothetical protein HOW73_47260 [Polyangiaceae bacterium]|nr:hypothetical protein [Polyangiaceae bacterium]